MVILLLGWLGWLGCCRPGLTRAHTRAYARAHTRVKRDPQRPNHPNHPNRTPDLVPRRRS